MSDCICINLTNVQPTCNPTLHLVNYVIEGSLLFMCFNTFTPNCVFLLNVLTLFEQLNWQKGVCLFFKHA